jgi:3-oxoacyl-[acyl-carrier-protein] synthase II
VHRRIAITGTGLAGPAGDPHGFAAALRDGRSAVAPIARFDASGFPSHLGGEVPADFDPTESTRKDQRRYIKKNRKVMARDIQLAIGVTCRAIVDTGLEVGEDEQPLPGIDHTRFGMIYGTSFIPTTLEDLAQPVEAALCEGGVGLKDWGAKGIPQMFPLWLLKHLPNMHACHAGILWDSQGPSNSLTCSDAGALVALDEAVRILRRGAADLMLVGGAESRVCPLLLIRYALLGRLVTEDVEPAKASRPFDRDALGWVAAEAAVAVVLEDLDMAEARGARLLGEVLGTGVGTTTAGINACDPDGAAVAAAVRRALDDAGVEPGDLAAVWAHGTGLAEQDRSEAAGLAAALGDAADGVPVTATKGVTGHIGAASGLADLSAAFVLAEDGIVPPILNCDQPDPEVRLNLVTGRAAELAGDLVLVTTNAVGGQTAAAVVRLNR